MRFRFFDLSKNNLVTNIRYFRNPALVPRSFYQRDDVLLIAKELLGKYLCTCIDGKPTNGMIVETEAYRAPEDKASHAYKNKLTKRTATMFENGGIAYVYLCYGIHHLFNVVTGSVGMAHAVLIRGLAPTGGQETMKQRRNRKNINPKLTAGPGVLTQALGITTLLNGISLAGDQSIWIEDRGDHFNDDQIISGPRVGVDYAEECAEWPWRYSIKDHPYCSSPRPNTIA